MDVLDASAGQDTVSWYENQEEHNWGRETSPMTLGAHVVTASATRLVRRGPGPGRRRRRGRAGGLDGRRHGRVVREPRSGRLHAARGLRAAPHRRGPQHPSCEDKGSTTDAQGNSCSWYNSHSGDCGSYDNAYFMAGSLCCGCGGGRAASGFDRGMPMDAAAADLDDDGAIDVVAALLG